MAKKLGTARASCDSTSLRLDATASAEEIAQLAWALAHPARVRIVELLLQRQSCVCGEIVAEMPLAQSTVSQHLKILKDCGVVYGEIDGPKVCYGIHRKRLDDLRRALQVLLKQQTS